MQTSRRCPSPTEAEARALTAPAAAAVPCEREGEAGYALLAVLVAVFLVLLALSVAAPTVARSLRREREVEAMHRANQYTRAIQLYYRRFGTYPGSMEQLEKSNQIRFLRERYTDPMTGKPDWRMIKVGENKTTVKGFFGQPLGGVASTGLGSAAGMASPGGVGASAGATGLGSGMGSGFGSSGIGGSGGSSTASGDSSGTSGLGTSGSAIGGSSPGGTGIGGSSSSPGGFGSSSSGAIGGAPFMGVGLPIAGNSVLTVNEKTSYPEWEFLYDPRIEQLRANVNILGGGMSSTSAGSLGSAQGLSSGTPGSPGVGTSGPGSSSTPGSSPSDSSPFGGSTFGSSSGSGTGSSPSGSSSSPQ